MFKALKTVRVDTYANHGQTYTIVAFWEVPSDTLRVYAYRGNDPLLIGSYSASEDTVRAMLRAAVPMSAVDELMQSAKQDIDNHKDSMWGMLEFAARGTR